MQIARQAEEKYLEALRRALDRAECLDVIFRRHMTDSQRSECSCGLWLRGRVPFGCVDDPLAGPVGGENGMKPLSQEQIARLDELGMVWRNKFEGEPLACTG